MEIPNFMVSHILPKRNDDMFTNELRLRNRFGNANWRAFQALKLQYDNTNINVERLLKLAENWKKELDGIEYPWLVWSVDDDWSYIQQKLVSSVGWTPIVGYNPRTGIPKKLIKESILLDFNKNLNLPILYMHFPIDFIFKFCPRLAFWHSDLLIRPEKMGYLSDLFMSLPDGEIAMTNTTKIKNKILQKLFFRPVRLFELAGCITNSASRNIYEHGCSIWQGWAFHPNCPNENEFNIRVNKYWDHGSGILYWQKRYGGKVHIIEESYLDEGHFSRTSKNDFKVISPNNESRNTGQDLKQNYNVYDLARSLGIDIN